MITRHTRRKLLVSSELARKGEDWKHFVVVCPMASNTKCFLNCILLSSLSSLPVFSPTYPVIIKQFVDASVDLCIRYRKFHDWKTKCSSAWGQRARLVLSSGYLFLIADHFSFSRSSLLYLSMNKRLNEIINHHFPLRVGRHRKNNKSTSGY